MKHPIHKTILSFLLLLLPSPSWADCRKNIDNTVHWTVNKEKICAMFFRDDSCTNLIQIVPNGQEEPNFGDKNVGFEEYCF